MKSIQQLAILLSLFAASYTPATELASGEYHVTQSWSQEQDFQRPYFVQVPEGSQKDWPVFIFLHGNGGNARGAMQRFKKRPGKILPTKYIVVCAQGYKESWNIVSERSRADDLGFIEAIITKLSTFDNVQKNTFSIMGSSNGAALVNQIAIETDLKSIRNYISAVSPLNAWQHDGKQFKAKGEDNTYTKIAKPLTGFRLMNISGTNDKLVPYAGGPSRHIPAKDGKLAFVDAEESIFLWAKHLGYTGEKLAKPSAVEGKVETFRYLNGDLVHYKVVDAGHGAGGAISEKLILAFLQGADATN